MTFLTPIPAIIAAAITLPALLVFYFLKLRRRPVRVSSTLLWMQATQDLQVNVPFRMIRPSWLLLLQLLILASLLLALARPAVHMDSAPAGRAIILIDRSASMSARDGRGGEPGETRLAEAKRRALAVVDSLGRAGSGTRVMVIAYAAEARALTGLTSDRGAVREAIRNIQPSDQPDNLAAALDLVAAAALADQPEAGDETLGPEKALVILLSDGGTPAPPGLALDNAEWRFEAVGPSPTDGPPLNNLGIVALSARRDYADPATVRIFVRTANAGPEPLAVSLALSLDGQVIDRRPLEVPGSTGPDPAEAGQAPMTFEFQNTGGGIALVSLGRADALAADDAAGAVLARSDRPGALLVVPADDPMPEAQWLIADVLAEMDLRPFRTVDSAEFARLAAEGGLGPYSLVVFDRVRPAQPPSLPSISFGGGLPPRSPALSPPGRLDGLVVDYVSFPTRFVSWDRAHPVLRDVSLDAVVAQVSTDPQAGAEPDEGRSITELARGERGPLIELVEDGGIRRILVRFSLARSNWPVSVSFPIFLSNAVDFLTLRGQAEAGRAFTTAEPVRLLLGADAASEITLRGPRQLSIRPARDPGTPAIVSAGILELAGIYTVEGSGASGDRAAAANLSSPIESAIRTSRERSIAGRSIPSGAGGAGPREVWPWFILAAAALLTIEWFVHAFLMRV